MESKENGLEDLLDDMDAVFEAMERIKAAIASRRPLLYERWKAGGFIVDADVVTMYPSLHDISQGVMDERDSKPDAGPEASASSPSIWISRSDMDGYFVTVFISPSGDYEAARKRAWEVYTGPQGRADVDQTTNEPEWKGFHTDPRGLVVFELGDGYVGSNGEGQLEADDQAEGAPARCEETDGTHGRCVLPIGHGADFMHDWERS